MRDRARTLASRVAADAAPRVAATATERSPVDSGELRASIEARADGANVVITARDYARFVGLYAAGFADDIREALRAVRDQ